MKENSCKYFENRDCKYFPCHDTDPEKAFNCLFCFCPLYALGEACGGDFVYTEEGIKDCTGCLTPHSEGGYEHVIARFRDVAEVAKQK